MSPPRQPENPDIRLVEEAGETTLFIDEGQAMQAWERELMRDSAELLCGYGSRFLEVGLGLGISALHIASRPGTRRHVVVEKYQRVIQLFRERNPSPPPSLEVVHADFFEHVAALEPESLDGIFFDPFLPPEMNNDVALWNATVPKMVRALRVGGALIPCFTSQPTLRWQFAPFFERVILERRHFESYATTDYMTRTRGSVYIQCFIRCA